MKNDSFSLMKERVVMIAIIIVAALVLLAAFASWLNSSLSGSVECWGCGRQILKEEANTINGQYLCPVCYNQYSIFGK
jgi:hypothetical protein